MNRQTLLPPAFDHPQPIYPVTDEAMLLNDRPLSPMSQIRWFAEKNPSVSIFQQVQLISTVRS